MENAQTEEKKLKSVSGCARCGGSHENLALHTFKVPFAPPEARGVVWDRWATCPATGDPILIANVPEAQASG